MQQNVIEGAEKHYLQNFVRGADCVLILKEFLKNFQRIPTELYLDSVRILEDF